MNKFKKGDKIICKNDQYSGLEKGKVYTVTKHDGDFVHCKELENGYFDFCFKPSADYLFEKLDFNKYEFKDTIEYLSRVNSHEIVFIKARRMVESRCGIGSEYITMRELQAINEKCKELGWLDEL